MIPLSDENRTRHAPVASRTILVTCCIVFIWQALEVPWGRLAAYALGFTPAYFFAGGPPDPGLAWAPYGATLITYMFLHAGWLHLAGNMLCLWIFGDDVEDSLGQPAFIVFYLLSGMAAALAQAAFDTDSRVAVVGASGAISGLFGAYLVLYPRSHVNVLVPIFIVWDVVRLPAWVVLVFWFIVQLLYDMAGPQFGGGVAFRAHIGGFIAGIAMTPVFLRVTGRRERVAAGHRGLIR
jgi:membrane associated rhomboid family serine protease